MSFLSSVGATNAIAVGSEALTRKMEEIRTQPQQEKAIQTEQALNETTLRARQFALQQSEEQYRYDNELLPLGQLIGSMPPPTQKYLEDFGRSQGFIEDTPGGPAIRRKHAQTTWEMIQKEPQRQLDLDMSALTHIVEQEQQLQTALQDPKMKEKDRQAAMQQLQGLGQDKAGLINSVDQLRQHMGMISDAKAEFYDAASGHPIKQVSGQFYDATTGIRFTGDPGQLKKYGVDTTPKTDFSTFESGQRAELTAKGITDKGKQDAMISDAWQKRQLALAQGKAEGQITSRMKDIDVPKLAQAVTEGHESLEGITNAFGVPVKAVVQSEIVKEYPKFDFIKSAANKRYALSPANLRSAGLAMSVYPRVESLKEKATNLSNLNPRILNMPMNVAKKQFGDVAVVDYESMRNAIIQEVNTALSGSSATSDMRIVLELENLKTSNTLGQHLVAIDNLLSALDARSDASTAILYPVEEIRGEVSFKGTQERRNFIRKQMMQSSGSTAGTTITQAEYQALIQQGHTPEQIKAEGFTVSP